MIDPHLTDDELELLQQLLSQSANPLAPGIQAKLRRLNDVTDHLVALQVDNYVHKGFEVYVACEAVAELFSISPADVRKIHKRLAKFEAKRSKAAKRLLTRPDAGARRRIAR